jgi:cell division protein FtsB
MSFPLRRVQANARFLYNVASTNAPPVGHVRTTREPAEESRPEDSDSSSGSNRSRPPVDSLFRRKALGIALFLILAATGLNAFFGERGVLALIKAREEHAALDREVAELEAANDAIAAEIRALKSDPLVVERLAREVLGMARPGEIVVTLRYPETR